MELFGDGESFDPDKGSYNSTGYVFIFGGWQNSLSVICRNGEHDDGRKAAAGDPRVEPNRSYQFTISRRGGTLDWSVDGRPFLSWTDPAAAGRRRPRIPGRQRLGGGRLLRQPLDTTRALSV